MTFMIGGVELAQLAPRTLVAEVPSDIGPRTLVLRGRKITEMSHILFFSFVIRM